MQFNENKFFDDNFFVVSSENLYMVKPKLYGYVFDNENIFINSDKCNYEISLDAYGCYVNVITTADSIKIYQDYFGSYGLYLFKSENFFAISNSFLYLVNYLKTKQRLTINDEFAKCLIAPPSAVLSFDGTLVNNIKMLPRNTYVEIDKSNKSVSVKEIEQKEFYINLDSREAIDIIDMWHDKWNKIIENIVGLDYPTTLKLSGGKDSRTILACLYGDQIKNIDKMTIFSAKDAFHTEDFEIATEISNILKFKLSTTENQCRYKMDPETNLMSSFFTKGGFHREICPTHFWKRKTHFTINGSVGGLRDYWNEPPEEFISKNLDNVVFHSVNCKDALKNILTESVNIVKLKNKGKKLTASDVFYQEIRCRHQYGKAMVESFLGNEIVIAPLMDPMLYKINQNVNEKTDNDLLYAIIYDRYLPELNNVKFDSGRVVIEKTSKFAHELNKQFLRQEKINKENLFRLDNSRVEPCLSTKTENALDVLKRYFELEDLKNMIYNYFGEEVYLWAQDYYKNSYRPYMGAAALVEFYIINKAVEESLSIQSNSFVSVNEKSNTQSKYYHNDGIMEHIYRFLQSLRIEVKGVKSENSCAELAHVDDVNAFIEQPAWMCDNTGKGFLVQSSKCKINIEITTKNCENGKLQIKLKGPWLKDENGSVVPIKIDVTSLKIFSSKQVVIETNNLKVVDSINFENIQLAIEKNKNYSIEIEWNPHIYDELDFIKLLHEMRKKNINYYKYWNK